MRAGLLRLPPLIPAVPDRDLLRRFADARDEGAFAELVRRHGPMVLAVCRRVVSDSHLADDAFQATFVVLARKAATAGVGARLSTWLHSVAVKVSLRARTMAGRRAKRETLTATVPERGIASVPPDDATAVLDEEIDRLPDHLKAAVVLCELRGVGRRDAAKELGIAEGTLSSRLAAARKKLAERLRARGVAPAAAIFPAVFVPTDLAAATVAVSTGHVDLSPYLAQLVEGGMQMTLLTKLKLAAVALAVAVLTVGGFGGWWGNESAAAPVPKDLADPGVIWMFHPAEGQLVGYAPDGKKVRTVKFTAGGTHPGTFFGITRDGQHALVAAQKGELPAGKEAGYDALHAGKLTVHLLPLFAADTLTDTGIGCQYWSRYVLGRDGKTLVVQHDRSPRDPQGVPEHPIKYETVAYDLTTFKGTKRPALEKGFWLVEELANGDRILALGQHGSDERPLQSFHLLAAGSDKPKPLTGEDETDYCALSPDGATLLVTRQFSSKSTPTDSYHRMYLLNRASGKAEPFAHRGNTQHAHGHWSPDGKRVVYEWLEEGPQLQERILGGDLRTVPISRAQVIVTDASGKTEKVILDLDGCPETNAGKAQTWHHARPKLVGWYPTRRNAPVPKAKDDPGVIWCYDHTTGKLLAYRPNGDKLKEWTLPYANWFKGVTPDGTRFVYGAEAGNKLPKVIVDDRPTLRLHTRPIDDDKGTDLQVPVKFLDQFKWSPDGKQFYRVRQGGEKLPTATVTRYDAAGKELKELQLQDRYPIGWTADGSGLVLDDALDGGPRGNAKFVTLDWTTGKTAPLFEAGYFDQPRLSPDGTKVLGFDTYAPFTEVEKPNKAVLVRDLASGKTTAVARREKQSHADGLWSPDGTRIAYRWQDSLVKPLGGGAFTVVGDWHFVTCDANGKNEATLFGGAPSTTQVTAWTATPPALKGIKPDPRNKNAPVPVPPKEDTMGLTASVTFDKKEVMLGEPTYFTFKVSNPTAAAWQFEEGGDYRNRLGRPNSFAVTVTGPDGKAVPQPDSGMDMGGMSVMVKLSVDGAAAFRPLFLPHWATFDKPGEYTVTVKRKVGLVPADAEDGFRAKATPVNLSATAKITVTPTDAKRMAALIEMLAKDMLDPKSPESDHATKKLLQIRDPRVIPHFIELGKRPRVEARYAACEALGRFKTDEAFAALKKLYATTGPDLKGSAINEQLEQSSADAVRHMAIGAIAECGHPDALPLVWKAAEDGHTGVRMTVLHKAYEVKSPAARKVIAALLTDADERIRGEAKRYTELLAKEKK